MPTEADRTQPVFNFQASIARLNKDLDLFRDMVQFFREDSPGLLREIREGLQGQDAHAVERAAHSLKGLASTFDALPTVTAASQLEQMGRSGDLTRAAAALNRLEAEAARLSQALSDFAPSPEV